MTHIHTLKNGVQIVTEPMKGYRSTSFGVFINVGSSDENMHNNGISHVIEHMLFKGTSNRTARAIADETTAIGGNLDAFTTKEYTCYYAQTLDIYLYRAIDLISDMLLNSLMNEDDLKKELGVILEEIDMYEDDAEDLSHELLQKQVWENHPVGFMISGEKDTVKKFKKEDIEVFIKDYYVGRNIVISVAGHFQEDKVIKHIEDKFSIIPKGQSKPKQQEPVYRHRIVHKSKAIEQIHMNLAYPCIQYNSPEKYIFTLFNNILGGNPNSRLFQEIREEKGMTYTIYSYGNAFKSCGLLQIYAAAHPSQAINVLEAIKAVIYGLERKPITQRELSLAKAQIETDLMIEAESTQTRMENNGKSLLYGGKIKTLDTILKAIDTVTAKDIHGFIEKYMVGKSPSLCLIGDIEAVDTNGGFNG